MMFSTDPANRKPKIDADRRVIRRGSSAKPVPEFADLNQFSDWIDAQLEKLEKFYVDFETQASLQRHYKR